MLCISGDVATYSDGSVHAFFYRSDLGWLLDLELGCQLLVDALDFQGFNGLIHATVFDGADEQLFQLVEPSLAEVVRNARRGVELFRSGIYFNGGPFDDP